MSETPGLGKGYRCLREGHKLDSTEYCYNCIQRTRCIATLFEQRDAALALGAGRVGALQSHRSQVTGLLRYLEGRTWECPGAPEADLATVLTELLTPERDRLVELIGEAAQDALDAVANPERRWRITGCVRVNGGAWSSLNQEVAGATPNDAVRAAMRLALPDAELADTQIDTMLAFSVVVERGEGNE